MERARCQSSGRRATAAMACCLVFVGCCLLMASAVLSGQPSDLLARADDRVRGDPQAPVTLIEYSDFTCGFCLKFFRET